MDLRFDWDKVKARSNLKKHGISFLEAKTVFNDPFLFTFPDEEHSIVEARFVSIGISARGRVLIVVHTYRDEIIRIISGRRATRTEIKTYEQEI